MTHPLIHVVHRTVVKHGLIPPGTHVLLAVSGGQDSLAMLHAVHALASGLDATVSVAHVHHGLRGAQADEDMAYVAGQCNRLNIPFHTEHASAREYAAHRGVSIEAAARAVRRLALERIAAQVRADRIAVGHTMDDRAETVLLNILRGTGIAGVAAMPHRDGCVIRPLLDATRQMTGEFCSYYGLVPRRDPMNRDLSLQRSRLRHEVLPYLRAYFNPAVTRALVRLSEIAEMDNAFLDEATEQRAAALLQDRQEGEVAAAVADVLSCHPALQRRIVRRLIAAARGHAQDVSRQLVEGVLSHAAAGAPCRASWTLPGDGAVVTVSHDALRVVAPRRKEAWYWSVTLEEPPSETVLPDGSEVRVERVVAFELPTRLADDSLLVPEDVLIPPLQLRTLRPGDRVRPLGLGGSKKLGDCFTDRKVPRAARHHVWLLADGSGVLWVPGVVADERVRIRAVPCPCISVTLRRSL